ncbi:HNH endonuclease [Streptomyces sp. NPDC059786]|uniref:HNH endonuclease n=1 Tax=Streptomyces sp. NPDC059786 TaxID=3346946 RepID=UPI0036642EB9
MTDSRPSKWAIVNYWATSPAGHDVFAPHLNIEDPCCFACGWFSERWKSGCSTRKAWERARLERAHIIPAGIGGSDKPPNIILLCTPCHAEAPDWFDPWEMATWISRRPDRPSSEMEQLATWIDAFNEVPQFMGLLREMGEEEGSEAAVVAALRRSLNGAVVHGGVGLRKATMTAIVRRAVAEVSGSAYLPSLPLPRSGATTA